MKSLILSTLKKKKQLCTKSSKNLGVIMNFMKIRLIKNEDNLMIYFILMAMEYMFKF